MNYEIEFTRSANEDLENAFSWYENERVGLGWEFRNEVALCIEKITNDKIRYQIYYADIHKIFITRFPYLLYFKKYEPEKKIVIGAVLHEKRNSDTIKQHLGL